VLIVQYPQVLDVVGYAGDTVAFVVPAPQLAEPIAGFGAFAHIRSSHRAKEPVARFDIERERDDATGDLPALRLTLRPDITEGLTRRRDLRRLPIPLYDEHLDDGVVLYAEGSVPVAGQVLGANKHSKPSHRQATPSLPAPSIARNAAPMVRPLGLGPSSRHVGGLYNSPFGDVEQYGWAWRGIWDVELRVFQVVNGLHESSIHTLRSGTLTIFTDITKDPV